MLRCVKALRLPLSTQYIQTKFSNIVPTDAFRVSKYISPTVTCRRISGVTMTSLKEDKTGKKIVTQVNGDVNVKVTRSSVTEVEKNWRDYYLNLKLEEKRKVYHCGSKFVVLDKIQSWPEYAPSIKVKVKRASKPLKSVDDNLNKKISLWRGDITKLEIDAIVNAANSTLMGGGGVDGAIHRGAGKKLMEECAKLNGCPTGNAKLTGGYKLPARYVIQTVGPIGENPEMLAKCYENCLDIAKKYDIKTVAFPCISTGIYGYDVEKATPVVMETVRKWLQEGDNAKCIDNIIFCVFLSNDVAVYESNLLQYFPVDKTDTLDSLPDKKRPKTSGEEKSAAGESDETKENVEVNDKSKEGIKDKQTDVEKLKDSDKKQKETEKIKITKL